jgi:hypothetical protein
LFGVLRLAFYVHVGRLTRAFLGAWLLGAFCCHFLLLFITFSFAFFGPFAPFVAFASFVAFHHFCFRFFVPFAPFVTFTLFPLSGPNHPVDLHKPPRRFAQTTMEDNAIKLILRGLAYLLRGLTYLLQAFLCRYECLLVPKSQWSVTHICCPSCGQRLISAVLRVQHACLTWVARTALSTDVVVSLHVGHFHPIYSSHADPAAS